MPLNFECDMDINKQQRHATLAFIKIDRQHGDPPVKGHIFGSCYIYLDLDYGTFTTQDNAFELWRPQVKTEVRRHIISVGYEGGNSKILTYSNSYILDNLERVRTSISFPKRS